MVAYQRYFMMSSRFYQINKMFNQFKTCWKLVCLAKFSSIYFPESDNIHEYSVSA